ncbi:MAG: hypothetical protein HGA44_05600 [Cellulomonadaceae bacterium]|nr:hypothetical protein [Cellulomonadaceae bacterium]
MSENPEQPTFPGLEIEVQTGMRAPSALELAAVATLTELRSQGLLRREHSLTVQLVLELSRAVGQGVMHGRASAVAMAAKQLTEAMALLPIPADDAPGESTDWLAFQAAVQGAPAAEGQAS